MTYYLAIDIGASSGRHILGYIENGKLRLEEVYRFDNGFTNENGHLIWNINHLIEEVKKGIKKCGEIGKRPKSIAVDTWGVDYVLLDKDKKEILPSYCYRDNRCNRIIPEVEKYIPYEDMYKNTGIQRQSFNTVYQLFCDKTEGKLDNAEYFLTMPSYISFKLTGVIKNEYTFATTTSLVNAKTKTWDFDIIKELGLPKKLFRPLSQPGDILGMFSEEMVDYAGFDSTVVFAPSHDTASASAACPMENNDMFISSGTWSLIGTEMSEAVLNDEARRSGFTNEGGIGENICFIKNYMGMWLLQCIRRDLNKSVSYDEMMHMAENTKKYRYLDLNDPLFTAPENMIEAIKIYFNEREMSLQEILSAIYYSMAESYRKAVEEIEKITNHKINAVHIVGGGCQDDYLNKLTAKVTGKTVTAGPVEATAIGNIISQLLADETVPNLPFARELIRQSFNIKDVS